MIIILLIVILVLILIIFLQLYSIRKRNQNLKYMHKQINDIISNKTNEKLLVFTDDKYLIPILIEINNLLTYNQLSTAKHMKMENSMKKMLSNISHDLKTPLTVILGYIETLQVDSSLDNEERKQLLLKMQEKTLELITLINKFFDLAKLESGDKKIPLKKINLNEVCRKNILSYYDILSNKGIDVDINIPDDNIYILGNGEALDRILNNLISNGIKYGADGNIIGFNLRTDLEFVYVEIWDKGKGISELHKDRVFERLYTLEDSRNKSFQGSGLGLTITKRLVEKLGGEIFLYSKPNDKTIFTLKFKQIVNQLY
ncbi:sensor histidine kinase [Vallitalea maricola]|uniref:HAMP domain-containing histidine kinase n=1 Tax=Vallitalea maricola TaxID=3074433 RepID=A0ACB5UET2_9FIRM|nr:HAMP domain-containing histidine kinase [Vallitalea sp. AN17-2]